MVNPDNTVFLKNILDSIEKIFRFVQNIDYEKFSNDEKTVSAVLRELSIIGEAARKVTDDFRGKHPEVPWEKIFGMRNKLVHDYMGVQLPIVWQTIQEDLPELKNLIFRLVESLHYEEVPKNIAEGIIAKSGKATAS